MEFSPALLRFQGVLISSDNIHRFSKIRSKGGNESKVKYIIEVVRKFLQQKYITKNGDLVQNVIPEMRKFAMYIVLNSNLFILEKLADLESINSVIWTIPVLPQYLMCELLWNLSMEKFIYEIVAFSYPKLSLEVTEALVNHVKYLSPFECWDKVKLLTSATYKLICRSYLFNFEIDALTDILKKASLMFQACVNYYIEPLNSENLNNISNDEEYKHKGICIHSILLLLYECLEHYTSKFENNDIVDDTYVSTYLDSITEAFSNETVANNKISKVSEFSLNCLSNLSDKCQALLMNISVDIFCAWSEFEENDKSMQETIGELCYKVHTKLQSIETLMDHPVVSMIQQISRKPTDYNEVINFVDRDTIIESINKNNEESKFWIHALINRNQLHCEEEFIKILIANIGKFDMEEKQKLLLNIYNKKSNDSKNINSYFIKIFESCNNDIKEKFLQIHFNNKCFNNTLKTPDFNNTLTETFNKISESPNLENVDILNVFLQCPEDVYRKIFQVAIENSYQSAIMSKVIKSLEKYSDYYYNTDTEACLIKVIKESFENSLETDNKQFSFIKFIDSLKSYHSITGPKLFLLIIMPNMHKALINKDIGSLKVQIQLLNMVYTMDELLEYRAPLLAMLGQVLETVRWKARTFDIRAPETLCKSIELQTSLMASYEDEIPEKEKLWLKSKLQNMCSLNMYYYRKLWNQKGNNFVEVITGEVINAQIGHRNLTIWLSKVLCLSIVQEWCEIWDSLSILGAENILEIMQNAITLLAVAEKKNRTPKTWACLLHCYSNYIHVIRYKYFIQPLDENQVSTVITKITEIMNLVEETNSEDVAQILMPILAYIVEKYNSAILAGQFRKYLKNKYFIVVLGKLFKNDTTFFNQ